MLDIVANKSNLVVIGIDNHQFLYSYKTLVAAFYSGIGYVKSNMFYSATTSKHIFAFCDHKPVIVTEDELRELLFAALADYVGNSKQEIEK